MLLRPTRRPVRAGLLSLAVSLSLAPLGASAATPAAAAKPAAKSSASTAPAAARKAAPPVADPGYRIAPVPAWVVDPPAASVPGGPGGQTGAPSAPPPGFGGLGATAGAPIGMPAGAATAAARPGTAASPGKALRMGLSDLQIQLAGPVPVSFYRSQLQALDSTTLREVSEPQLIFNPEYQKLVIHQVVVIRDGQRQDRTKGLRVEMMRREQGLEQLMLTGQRTALLMLNDVRVGDVVELAYSIEGENPIFEGRFADLIQVSREVPIDRAFARVLVPKGRTVQTRAIGYGTGTPPAVRRDPLPGGGEALTLFAERVPAVPQEVATPPWVKVFPAVQFTEYRDWQEVDRWAQGLFAMTPPGGEIAERIAAWKARELPPEALVAEVLRFVQDEVRYFSMSLGESSHRPKPAARTLSERLGDCKDKVLLLNTLLTGLGFDAKPALVSMLRNRGIVDYLPTHDQFDHVITRVVVGDQVFFLDPTMNGQGLSLRGRGYYPYGQVLVVGEGKGPQPVVMPAFARDEVRQREDWDLSDLRRTPTMTASATMVGLSAERWRAYVAGAGMARIGEMLGGAYIRQYPELKPVGEPELADSRETNELSIKLRFESPMPGELRSGSMRMTMPQLAFLDFMTGPPEATRRTPFLIDQPLVAESRITLTAPVPLDFAPSPARQAGDGHFGLSMKSEVDDRVLTLVSRYERRDDHVLPADLDAYRQAVLRARQTVGTTVGFSLLSKGEQQRVMTLIAADLKKWGQPDGLARLALLTDASRARDALLLSKVPAGSAMARTALAERATLSNHLAEHDAALQDADAALAIDPADDVALEARGVALFGLGRLEDAAGTFERLEKSTTRKGNETWLGITQLQLGRYDDAERSLRRFVDATSSDQRSFGLLWLALAMERREAGSGRTMLAAEVRESDTSWAGSLVRFLAGRIDRDALLKTARADADAERMRLAEAYFYIGQTFLTQGRREDAKPWFERVIGTQAVSFREYVIAQQELKPRPR